MRRNLKKTRKKARSVLVLIAVGVAVGAFFAYMLWPLRSAKYQIVFDAEKIKFREEFLAQKASLKPNSPNIILILADDLGKTDISLYGGQSVQTSNIDAIGLEGVTFNEGYITSPICSPSRAGLMTGRYQQRFGFELNIHERYPKNRLEHFVAKHFIAHKGPFKVAKEDKIAVPSFEDMHKQGLPPTEFLLSELLKKQGYQTAMFGKWHMGYNQTALPLNRGFDYHYGFYEAFSLYAMTDDSTIVNEKHDDFTDKHIWNKGRKGNCAIYRNGTEVKETAYLTTKIAAEACSWIDENYKNGPFFMYLPFSAPHTPFQATKKHFDLYAHITDRNKRVYYAMIHALDEAVGEIRVKLKTLGLEENTLIVFLSDNGGATYTHATDNAPLKGGKFSNFEGGINIPFMLQWKGELPNGLLFEHPVSSLDIFATICAVAGVELPQDRSFDGVNLLPFVKEEQPKPPHEALYWRSLYHKAIRMGKWKMVIDELAGQKVLYNLEDDKPEKHNLMEQCKEVAAQLETALAAWEKQLVRPNWPRVMDFEIIDGEAIYYFPL